MAIKRMPAALFAKELGAAYERKDGYIMGATGQDPRKWPADSHWFTQYSGAQREKALYWREHAQRVWDCNGLAEGLYKDYTGKSINSRARYNFADWCDPKGEGMIPPKYRVAGAAVFWGERASDITHVAFLYKPVDANKPRGDWYLIEARGVMSGVCRTKLLSRKPDFWGLMTKYFDYGAIQAEAPKLGDRLLKNGCEGADVKELQTDLIRLGYDCGRWGADGDFGDATELAVRAFQRDHKLDADGVCGPKTCAALEKALAKLETRPNAPRLVKIVGGKCYVRDAPNTSGKKLGVAHAGDRLAWLGEIDEATRWLKVDYLGRAGWVSGKYGKLL